MPELLQSLGCQYLQVTKFDRSSLGEQERPRIDAAATFKRYPEVEKTILPRQWPERQDSLWELLQHRRSERRYGEAPLSRTDLAMLLWACQGITAQSGNYFLRSAPSAGALYPVETYVAVQRSEEVSPGLFHFDPTEFVLDRLGSEPPGVQVAHAALDQRFLAEASAVFIWSAVFRRNMAKYGHRGLRYILLDAGHICENLLLAAQALGLAACPVAAFYDDELNRLLGLDGEEESVLYLAAVGGRR